MALMTRVSLRNRFDQGGRSPGLLTAHHGSAASDSKEPGHHGNCCVTESLSPLYHPLLHRPSLLAIV